MTFANRDWLSADCAHVLHPWANVAALGAEAPMMLVEAEGVRVKDSQGNTYLDAIGGMWCMTVGYGRHELADAMQKQALRLPYYTPFGAMANEPAAELAARLAALAPGDLKRVHFTTCGSTAVESALRFAHYYFGATGRPAKKHIVSRVDAYHGSTYLAASVSGKQWDRTCFHYEDTFVHLLQSPNVLARPPGMSVERFCDRLVDAFERLIARVGAENIACFIAEPILASGGVIVPPDGYHQRMLEVCRRHDVLYISDEVVTGIGRLGHYFASEARFGIVPDMIVSAKGLTSGYQPLGAVLISERLLAEISGPRAYGHGVFTHGFTYSGHPVACAVALANLDLMEREGVCAHVREVGPYFQARLAELRDFPVVRDIRGDHLMACIECRTPDGSGDLDEAIRIAGRIDAFCQAKGLLVRPYENLCILSPPLIVSRADIDAICEILRAALETESSRAFA
ncbi:aminotransferase [Paraburkholderia sp. Tr-20389]|uniref:aminotransferase n=1 Tax=Paraburkholderia sp. Tr-20389 TaxID=2703903 RepID=UPI0019804C8A|nr:aminotransferase [Paraburkholderia sp. Tr-20389]MBN3758339.1 aminotransferase [Paraburkholderia sp. Tr-20389]